VPGFDVEGDEEGEAKSPSKADVKEDEVTDIKYEELLELFKTIDFTEIEKLKFITKEGVDLKGRPIIQVQGDKILLKTYNLGHLLIFAVKFIDQIVDSDYSLIYLQSGSSSANRPSFGWLARVYKMLPRKYKKKSESFIHSASYILG